MSMTDTVSRISVVMITEAARRYILVKSETYRGVARPFRDNEALISWKI